MTNFKTEQEAFWAGAFGNEYIGRNTGDEYVANQLAFFSKIISSTRSVESVIEFGANIGLNLRAIRAIIPHVQLSGIEINANAVNELKNLSDITVYHQSILDFQPDHQRDLSLIKGVLIHLNPDCLPQVYDLLYQSSSRYICVAEYYNPTPVEISYRGHSGKLFKRDFAGELMDIFPDLQLVDYGFAYHRDINFPQDDITWFLMEKVKQ